MTKDCKSQIPPLGSICLLCQDAPPIKNSHVWPRFAVNWQKENHSPYIRRGDSPNLRMQDVTKYPLLCRACETRFSRFEDKFCSIVYKPFLLDKAHKIKSFKYGRWLSHFVISLSWRMLAIDFKAFCDELPAQSRLAIQAFEHWRRYLLGESLKIRPYRHHLFFFSSIDPASSAIQDVPPKLHRYVHSAFDGGTYFEPNSVVYTLLPGIAFWSPLRPGDEGGFEKESAVQPKGILTVRQVVSDGRFATILQERSEFVAQPLSDRQEKLITKEFDRIKATKSQTEIEETLAPLRQDQKIARYKELDQV